MWRAELSAIKASFRGSSPPIEYFAVPLRGLRHCRRDSRSRGSCPPSRESFLTEVHIIPRYYVIGDFRLSGSHICVVDRLTYLCTGTAPFFAIRIQSLKLQNPCLAPGLKTGRIYIRKTRKYKSLPCSTPSPASCSSCGYAFLQCHS